MQDGSHTREVEPLSPDSEEGLGSGVFNREAPIKYIGMILGCVTLGLVSVLKLIYFLFKLTKMNSGFCSKSPSCSPKVICLHRLSNEIIKINIYLDYVAPKQSYQITGSISVKNKSNNKNCPWSKFIIL